MIYYKRKNFAKNGSALGWSIVHYNHLSEKRVWFVMYNRIQTIAIQKLVNFYSFLRCHYWHGPDINLCLILPWTFWPFPRKWGLSSSGLVQGTKVQSQSNSSSWHTTVGDIKCIYASPVRIITPIITTHAAAKTQRRIAMAVVVIKQDRSDAILLTIHEWILSSHWWITTQHIWCPFLPI